ncbi:MAG: hypothetical protein NUW01_17070 [Gemmatimonadaceae bacterium]|nr:hypothetical protein [Gemmatimonadaceae bacterium]
MERGLAHWQGRTDARVEDTERRLNAVNGSIEETRKAVVLLNVTVAGLVAKVAVASAFAALVGSGVMTLAVYFITR